MHEWPRFQPFAFAYSTQLANAAQRGFWCSAASDFGMCFASSAGCPMGAALLFSGSAFVDERAFFPVPGLRRIGASMSFPFFRRK